MQGMTFTSWQVSNGHPVKSQGTEGFAKSIRTGEEVTRATASSTSTTADGHGPSA